MQNPTPRNENKFTRRSLLQYGTAAGALSILGNKLGTTGFAQPILSGDPNEDAKRAVAQIRSEMHHPEDLGELDPKKINLPQSSEYYARKIEVLAYAADLDTKDKNGKKIYEKEYDGRKAGIENIRNLALGTKNPKFDPDGSKLRRGMATLFGQKYEPQSSPGEFLVTRELQNVTKAADLVATGVGLVSPFGGLMELGLDFAKDPAKYGGQGYGLETESLFKGLSAEATRRVYALPLDYKKGELDFIGKKFGVDLAADLEEHLNYVPQGVKDYVEEALKAKIAGTPIDGETFVKHVVHHISKNLAELKSSIAVEIAEKIKADNEKAEEEKNKHIKAAEDERIKQQQIQGEIQGGAYLASWVGQTFLDPKSAEAVSKITNAAISTMAIQSAIAAGTMGPVGATAGVISLMSSFMEAGATADQQIMEMLQQLSGMMVAFRDEMRAQFGVVNKKLDYITELQLETLKRLSELANLYSKGDAAARIEFQNIEKQFVALMRYTVQEDQDNKRGDYRLAKETLFTEHGDKTFEAGDVQRAMEKIYDFGINKAPSLTRKDVVATDSVALNGALKTLGHVAHGVGMIPSIYKGYTNLEFTQNPLEMSGAMVAFAAALEKFPQVEVIDPVTRKKKMVGRAEDLQTGMKKTLTTLVEATSAENIKKLSEGYAKDVTEIYNIYIEELHKKFMAAQPSSDVYVDSAPDGNRRVPVLFHDDERFRLLNADSTYIHINPEDYRHVARGKYEGNVEFLRIDGVNGFYSEFDTKVREGEFFTQNSGHSIIDMAQKYGLISVTRKEHVALPPYSFEHDINGNKYTRAVEEERQYYDIRFKKGPNAETPPITICATTFKSTGLSTTWIEPDEKATVLSLKETDPRQTVDALNIPGVGVTTGPLTMSVLMDIIGKNLVEHHRILREDFFKKAKAGFTADNVKKMFEAHENEDLKKIVLAKMQAVEAKGLSLRYLAGLRHWLDTGDAETATAIATHGAPGMMLAFDEFAKFGEGPNKLGMLFDKPDLSADDPKTKGATSEDKDKRPIPYGMVDKMQARASKQIAEAFDAQLATLFPDKPRIVNAPEITMAELAMVGSLAAVEKRDKSPKKPPDRPR